MLTPSSANPPAAIPASPATKSVRTYLIPLAALAAVLVLSVPLFLASPVWVDTLFYDMCARNVLNGGMHYRDIFDTNLPGMVWLQLGIRVLLGWSSEAMRMVDLVAVSAIIALLLCWVRPLGLSRARRIWLAVVLFACYFSLYEWCHCQRDVWMLLPALIAIHLRRRQVLTMGQPSSIGARLCLSFVEGSCWSLAIWIKPMIALPGIATWAVATVLSFRMQRATLRIVAVDLLGLLSAAGIIGGAGIFCLWRSGTWAQLMEVMRTWNPEYLAHVWDPMSRWCGYRMWFETNLPWPLVHLLALPATLWAIWRYLLSKNAANESGMVRASWLLLVGLYYGWHVQAILLQQSHEYVQVPAMLLAIAMAATLLDVRIKGYRPVRFGCFVFLGLAAMWHPMLRWNRVAQWPQAIAGANRVGLRDRLALTTDDWGGAGRVDWRELKRVEEFLRTQDIHDGELTCFNDCTFPLYLELQLAPSTRWLYFHIPKDICPSHREEVRAVLASSRQRFVVADLMSVAKRSMWEGEADGPVNSTPSRFPKEWRNVFPWYEPVVFRAGRYEVHRVTQPARAFWPQ